MACAQAFATIGACIKPVRFGPVVMLQYAVQFVALAVPSSAARVALEIRFFAKVGMSSAGAVAVGVIDSVCGFIVQMLFIIVIMLSGLATLDLSDAIGVAARRSPASGCSLRAVVAACCSSSCCSPSPGSAHACGREGQDGGDRRRARGVLQVSDEGAA